MSSRYDRPPWKPVNEKQFDVRLSAFGPGTSNERYRTETVRKLGEDYGKHVKIYTDGSQFSCEITVFIAGNCVLCCFNIEFTKKINKITYKIDKNANICSQL
jgi:hypothetical protein